ncbi:chromosome partitioning protein [Blautia sp. An249]|uniref:ParA family protein n=1 Tax=Blautia sp. An249 TaxID=1965603 RepID=UPI000B39024C|nr:ParA family protein [Blautia sp. An249]OUO76952.1 chromosome partitioning protein [Blautia sp. An249]
MKTISLINMKGGVGKTTMAVNLADFLVNRESKNVLLVDVDPQFNATQCVLSGKDYINYIKNNGYTIVDIFDNSSHIVTSVVKGNKANAPLKFSDIKPIKSSRGFYYIPGALQLFKLEMAAGSGRENRLRNYLKTLENKFDYVIIDSPPTPSVWMISALIASDYYLIPVKPDPISMTGLDLLQGIINERADNYGFDCKCCGIVLTMVDLRSTLHEEAQNYFSSNARWNNLLYGKFLLKRTQIARGQLRNQFIRDLDDSKLKMDFSAIVKEFIRRTGK